MREHYRAGSRSMIQEIDGTLNKRNHYFVMDFDKRMMITGPLGEGKIGLRKAQSVRDGLKRRVPQAAVAYCSEGVTYPRHIQGDISRDIQHGPGDSTHKHRFSEHVMNGMWMD